MPPPNTKDPSKIPVKRRDMSRWHGVDQPGGPVVAGDDPPKQPGWHDTETNAGAHRNDGPPLRGSH